MEEKVTLKDFTVEERWYGGEDNVVEITYTGSSPDMVIPAEAVSATGREAADIRINSELEEVNSITLPKNVSSIWFPPFYQDRHLTAIRVDPDSPYFKEIDGALYTKDGKKLVKVPALTEGEFTVPEGVEEIEYGAFHRCKVERISLPDTVKDLRGAFRDCENLRALTIPASIAEWEIDNVDFSGPLEEFTFLGKVEIDYHRSERNLPEKMEEWITGESFERYSEAYILACLQQDFPDLDRHRKRFLAAAKRARRMKIAAWLEETAPADPAGSGAEAEFTFAAISDVEAELKKCAGGENIVIPARFEGRQVVSIAREAFKENYDAVRVTVPEGIVKIGRGAFAKCAALEEVVLPESCTAIENEAFFECKSLKRVNLPKGLTKLSDKVFCDCQSLEALELPAGLKSIGSEALRGCTALTSLTLPDGLESIGKEAFHGSGFDHGPQLEGEWGYSLSDFTIPASVTKISSAGYGIFAGYAKAEELFGVFEHKVRLHVVKGSAAHKYAMKNKIRFILE